LSFNQAPVLPALEPLGPVELPLFELDCPPRLAKTSSSTSNSSDSVQLPLVPLLAAARIFTV